jgi:hypothetical protein
VQGAAYALASVDNAGMLLLWSADGRLLSAVAADRGNYLFAVVAGPAGLLATAGDSSKIKLWRVHPSGSPVICVQVPRGAHHSRGAQALNS